MLQQAFSLSVPIFFLILKISAINPINVYVQCSELYFTSMTPYESNVNSLFTSLTDSASISNFNKFEISLPGYSQSDIVYGLFQCRGDLNSSNCRDCVANSVSQLKTTCPVSTGGTIQLEECFVKYDSTCFFGVADKLEVSKKCGPSIGHNSDVLNSRDDVLTYLIVGKEQYFRMGDIGSIHGAAQCVQDLSVSDCQDCLMEASGRLRSECGSSSWGDMYLGKCYIQYDDHRKDKNSCNKNDPGVGTSIMTQAVGASIGGVVTAIATAVVTYFVSSKVSKIRVQKVYITLQTLQREIQATKKELEEREIARLKAKSLRKQEKEAKFYAYVS